MTHYPVLYQVGWLELNKVVLLLPCGLVGQLIGDVSFTLSDLLPYLIVVLYKHLQHCIFVLLVNRRGFIGCLLRFQIRLFLVVLLGFMAARSMSMHKTGMLFVSLS